MASERNQRWVGWRDEHASVWKFAIDMGDAQHVVMLAGARLLHVAEQHGEICLWAAVDTRASKVRRRIQVAGTGHPLPVGDYVGTVVTRGGALVWHVYDSGEV